MKLRAPISTVVAIFTGVGVLILYFLPFGPLREIRQIILQWVMILAAFALIVGVLNLMKVHWGKMQKNQPGSFYSAIILLSFIITLIAVLVVDPASQTSVWIFNSIEIPIESSLMAILAIVLAYACARLMYRRMNAPVIVFWITVVVVLLGLAPFFLFSDVTALTNIRLLVMQWLAVGGGRGLLLGVALGTLAVGARILMGIDRPYGG